MQTTQLPLTRLAAAVVVTLTATASLAQTNVAPQPSGMAPAPASSMAVLNALPPALRAAVLNGNTQAIQQVLNTLSGGSPSRLVGLAHQVVQAAQALSTTNPGGAVSVATAAVSSVNNPQALAAAPQQAVSLVSQASALTALPVLRQNHAERTAYLGATVLGVAAKSNNPALAAQVAVQAAGLAEALLPINPAAAVQLAAQAALSGKAEPVLASAPREAIQVATMAARIAAQPQAQAVGPQLLATLAALAVDISSASGPYTAAPSAAIATIAQSHALATSLEKNSAAVASLTAHIRSQAYAAFGPGKPLAATLPAGMTVESMLGLPPPPAQATPPVLGSAMGAPGSSLPVTSGQNPQDKPAQRPGPVFSQPTASGAEATLARPRPSPSTGLTRPN